MKKKKKMMKKIRRIEREKNNYPSNQIELTSCVYLITFHTQEKTKYFFLKNGNMNQF